MPEQAPQGRDADPCPSLTSCPDGDHLVVCHVAALDEPDIAVVDALARLQLVVRRSGHRLVFCHPPAVLVELVELAGLAGVLNLQSVVEVQREPEEREQPIGAEEGVHRLDLPP